MTNMARWMGCGIGEFPFTYLRLPIGENMRRVKAWGPVVEKFKNKLVDWKAKTMSFGGRLTLVKSVLGSLPLYYFSMFRDSGGGGLGVRAGAWGSGGGVWNDIVRSGEEIDGTGLEFTSSCIEELGDGRDIRFWLDRWVDNRRLCDRFPRLYYLDRRKKGCVRDKGSWVRNIRGRVSRESEELLDVVQNVVVNSNCGLYSF
ncbi:hypothetical protein Tco_0403869 [Tanacetum coccineum]